MTPRLLLRQTAARLRECGVPDPEIDASLLLSHVTGLAPLALRLDSDRQLTEDELALFDALCKQRMQRIPLQYLLGEQPFMGRSFRVDSRVLIPRPETELLCERAIAALRAVPDSCAHALDLCCGSGCLGVSLALEVPDAQVDCADLSPDALAVSRMNAELLGASVTFYQGDLFAAVGDKQYHVIVSNPPYIPSDECLTLQEEVRLEPLMALDGGATGLDFYRRIAQEAPAHLLPGGVLLLEVGWDQGEAVRQLLEQAGMVHTAVHQDLAGIGRMVEGHMPFGETNHV